MNNVPWFPWKSHTNQNQPFPWFLGEFNQRFQLCSSPIDFLLLKICHLCFRSWPNFIQYQYLIDFLLSSIKCSFDFHQQWNSCRDQINSFDFHHSHNPFKTNISHDFLLYYFIKGTFDFHCQWKPCHESCPFITNENLHFPWFLGEFNQGPINVHHWLISCC